VIHVLGLDLGTQTGWGWLRDGKRYDSGVWNCKPPKGKPGIRLTRFHSYLLGAIERVRYKLDLTEGQLLVAYEASSFQRGPAREVWWGLYAMLRYVCDPREIPCVGIPVATIKRRATGSGRASKVEMIKEAIGGFGVLDPDHNEADALWCAQVAWESWKSKTQQ
jgi:hypothetical protein